MKRTIALAFLIVGSVAFGVVADGPTVSIDDLAWMAGHWKGTSEEVVSEEGWFAPSGGVMLGLHRDVASGQPAFFEYLRIEERDGTLMYVAAPMGGRATDFVLARVVDHAVTFENLDHDFPQQISYRRDGDQLTATVAGKVNGQMRSEEWVWELMP